MRREKRREEKRRGEKREEGKREEKRREDLSIYHLGRGIGSRKRENAMDIR